MTGSAKKRQEEAWNKIVDGVQALYPEPLPQAEAEDAARNLVRFCKTLLAIKQRQLNEKQGR